MEGDVVSSLGGGCACADRFCSPPVLPSCRAPVGQPAAAGGPSVCVCRPGPVGGESVCRFVVPDWAPDRG